jgi:large subunit ribosomal protein L9
MKIILRQDVDTLGAMGEIVTVKHGYARNYLIPRSMAYLASDASIKALEIEKKRFSKRLEKEKEHAIDLSAQLSELQVSVAMKVGEEGRLYGSVTPQMIAQELTLRGFDIDRRHIIIEDPIKSLGVFDVKVKLHTDVVTTLKVWVISEE